MGLTEKNEVSDIDIILVNPSIESLSILDRLQKDHPAKTVGSGKSCFIFQHDDLKIDVFIEKTKIETSLMVNSFLISPILRIINAKKSMSRHKDWIQLRKISRKIFTTEEFERYLNSK
jgi:hypothetical protein